jgi:hypothetical protein
MGVFFSKIPKQPHGSGILILIYLLFEENKNKSKDK